MKQAIEREAAQLPPLPALPHIAGTDATSVPVISALPDLTVAMDIDPVPHMVMPEDVSVIVPPPDAPHIPAVPPTILDARPVSVPSLSPTPSLTVVPAAVSPGPPVPILSDIGAEVPPMAEPPSLAGVGKVPPILPQIDALYDIGSPAPTLDAPPGLTKLGEDAPTIPAAPILYRLGEAAPNMPSLSFTLWDLGPDIPRDAEGDAIEQDLRAAVERETIRRQEVASAKPLDPFSGAPGSRPDPEFEELLAVLEKQPELLMVHEGQIFPGDALPARLRKALHSYALHPRARTMMINTAKNATSRRGNDATVKSPASAAARAAAAQAARSWWQR